MHNLKPIGKLIEKSRRAIGVAPLLGQSLVEAAQDWAELLADIPADQLEACYRQAMRTRKTQGALQPSEIVAAWSTMSTTQSHTGVPVYSSRPCEHCDGNGWQFSEHGARPCVCGAAPAALRAQQPLSELGYRRNERGVWVRYQMEAA